MAHSLRTGTTFVELVDPPADVPSKPKSCCRRNLLVLCTMCFVANIALSSTWSPLMEAFQRRACTERGLSPSCTSPPISNKEATNEGVKITGTFGLVLNGCNFLVIALLGELSDACGRRVCLMITLVGHVGFCLCWIFVWPATFVGSNTVFWAVHVACALTGGQFSIYSQVFAALSDELVDATVAARSVWFGGMTALLYGGLVVGPVVIGAIIDHGWLSVETSFWFGLALFSATLLLTCAGFSETLPRARRRRFSWLKSNPASGVWLLMQAPLTRWILATQLMLIIEFTGIVTLVPVAAITKGFSALDVASYQSCIFGSFAIGNLFLVSPMVRVAGPSGAAAVGCLLMAVLLSPLMGAALVVPSLTKPWVLLVFCIPCGLAAAWDAPLRSLAVAKMGPSNYGLTVAGIASIQCLFQGIAGKMTTGLYTISEPVPFIVCTAVGFLGFGCACRIWFLTRSGNAGISSGPPGGDGVGV